MALILRLLSGSSAKRPEPSGINAMPRVQRILTGQPWSISGEPGLEFPQHLVRQGVDGHEVAVRFAAKQQATGSHRGAAATAHLIGRLLLPYDLVCVAVDGG